MEMTVICVLCGDDAWEGVQLGGRVTFVNAISCACRIREKERPEQERRRNQAWERLAALFGTLCNYRRLISEMTFVHADIMFQLSDRPP